MGVARSFTYKISKDGKKTERTARYQMSDEAIALAKKIRSMFDVVEENKSKYEEIKEIGHSGKHMGCTEADLMNSLLEKPALENEKGEWIDNPNRMKRQNGCFESEETACNDVMNVIYGKADAIAAWLCGDLYDPPHITPKKKIALDVQLSTPEEILDDDQAFLQGPAFFQTDDDIYLTGNTHLTVVLEPLKNLYGEFRLVTAYPHNDNDKKNAPRLKDDVLPILRQTRRYQEADPFWKAAWEYKAQPKPEKRPDVKIRETKNGPSMIVECGKKEKFRIFGDGEARFEFGDGKTSEKITPQNKDGYMQKFKQEMKIVDRVSDRIKTLSCASIGNPKKIAHRAEIDKTKRDDIPNIPNDKDRDGPDGPKK